MKKVSCLVVFCFCVVVAFYAQNNESSCAKDEYRIKGVSSTEDIGGVAVERTDSGYYVINNNDFAVKVLIQATPVSKHCSKVVSEKMTKELGVQESEKLEKLSSYFAYEILIITRKK